MPKLFASYIRSDEYRVASIIQQLLTYGYDISRAHETVTDSVIESVNMDALDSSDALLLFLTHSSLVGPVLSELEFALKKGKPIISIITEGVEIVPQLQDYLAIRNDEKNPEQTAQAIHLAIVQMLDKKPDELQSNQFVDLTPGLFAEQFYNFLEQIKPHTGISGWRYEGATDIAYSTPAGAWESDGFLFTNAEYSFVVRSVTRTDNNYLVIESVNLAGQLGTLP